MSKLVFSIFLVLYSNLAFSQSTHIISKEKAHAINKINVFLTPQLYLNSANVTNDGSLPDAMSAKNTLGFQIGAEYERVSRSNILLSAGLLFGTHKHNVDIRYTDFSFIDPIDPSLKQTSAWNYTTTLAYLSPRIMIGYRFNLSSDKIMGLDVKVGLSSRLYLSGLYKFEGAKATFMRNDTIYSNVTVVDNTVSLGNTKGQGTGSFIGAPNFDAYIGIVKNQKTWFFKDFSIGLHVTHSLIKKSPSDEILNRTWNGRKVISVDRYSSKDFSLGLRLAIGL